MGLGPKFLVSSQVKWFEQREKEVKKYRFDFFVYEGHDSWFTQYHPYL
jgi:hypothetical protein